MGPVATEELPDANPLQAISGPGLGVVVKGSGTLNLSGNVFEVGTGGTLEVGGGTLVSGGSLGGTLVISNPWSTIGSGTIHGLGGTGEVTQSGTVNVNSWQAYPPADIGVANNTEGSLNLTGSRSIVGNTFSNGILQTSGGDLVTPDLGNSNTPVVPEPTSLACLSAGALALGTRRRRK